MYIYIIQIFQLVIEAAAGASVAAVMSDQLRTMDPKMQNVAAILCGGNIDIEKLPW